MSKGSRYRRSQITTCESDLRWELAFCKDDDRKKEIIEQLEEIEILKSENVKFNISK